MKTFIAIAAAVTTLTIAHSAWAGCRIHNDTKWSFKVESDDYSVDERGQISRQVIEQSIAAVGVPFLR